MVTSAQCLTRRKVAATPAVLGHDDIADPAQDGLNEPEQAVQHGLLARAFAALGGQVVGQYGLAGQANQGSDAHHKETDSHRLAPALRVRGLVACGVGHGHTEVIKKV